MSFERPDTHILTGLCPIDRNDPASENTATEYALPTGFSDKAKACWDYFEGAAYLFSYKGSLVMTKEGL